MAQTIKTETIEYKGTILLIFTLDDGDGELHYGFSTFKGGTGSIIRTKEKAIAQAKDSIDEMTYRKVEFKMKEGK